MRSREHKKLTGLIDQDLRRIEEEASRLEMPLIEVPPFHTWARQQWIMDRGNRGSMPFTDWTRGQKILADYVVARRNAGKQIKLVLHKERQMSGISTMVQAWQLYLVRFHPHRRAATIAHREQNSRLVHGFIRHYYENWPEDERALATIMVDGIEFPYPHNSALYVLTAGATESARGGRFNYVHLSEYAFFENPGAFMAALQPSIPTESTNDISLIIESTAKGSNDFKALLDMGFDPDCEEWDSLFISWKDETRCVAQVPRNFKLSEKESGFQEKYALTMPQMAWWRKQLAKVRNVWEVAHQEWPVVSELAFQYTGWPLFSQEVIQRALDNPTPPLLVGRIEWGSDTYPKAKLVEQEFGRLEIFKLPHRDMTAAIGMDVAYGVGRDYTEICGLECGTGEHLFHYRDNRVLPEDAAEIAYRLGVFYGWALLGVEHNGPGIAVLLALSRGMAGVAQISQSYPNLYQDQREDQETVQTRNTLGFSTTKRTKEPALTAAAEDFGKGVITVYAKSMLRQLKGFSADENNRWTQNYKDPDSGLYADDGVIALAIANHMRRQVERSGTIRKINTASWGYQAYLR